MSNIKKMAGRVKFDRNYNGPMAPRVIVKKLGSNSAPFFVHLVPDALLEAISQTAFLEISKVEAFGAVENQGFEWIPGYSSFRALTEDELADIPVTEAEDVTPEELTKTTEEVQAEKAAARERRRAAAKADSAVATGEATAV